MLKARRCIALGVCGIILVGCQTGQLYVGSNTVVGVHAAVNTAQSSGSVQIGYDRQFVTVVPRSVTMPADQESSGLPAGTTGREAMAVSGCSNVEVDGIFLSRFTENLATGRASLNYAKALKSSNAATAQKAVDFITCATGSTP